MASARSRATVLLAAAVLVVGACRGDTAEPMAQFTTTSTSAPGSAATPTAAGGESTPDDGAADTPTTGAGTNVGGPPTSVARIPFQAPKPGAYNYHERIQPGTGSPTERTVRYQIKVVSAKNGTVRWDEADPSSGVEKSEGDHFEEVHDRDGLYLLASIVLGKDECRWTPRSAMLPRSVIEGGQVETRSTCTVLIDGQSTELTLVTTLKFLRTHDFTVAGKVRPSIDVSRIRVLSGSTSTPFTITSRAVDTYAFDLGVRVKTEDHSTTESAGRSHESTRTLILTSAP